MRYLENAFRFVFKNYILGLPLLIIAVIPAILQGIGGIFLLVNYTGKLKELLRGLNNIIPMTKPTDMVDFYLNFYGMKFIIFTGLSLLVTLVLSVILNPAQYGLITRKLNTGKAALTDISSCISKYIGRYVLVILLQIAIILAVAAVFGILMFVSILTMTASLPIGILIMVLSVLLYIAGIITVFIYMSLWLPAVFTEDCGVIKGLTLSFKTVKGSFWMILGISLLVGLCSAAATGIMSLVVGWIPIAGTIIVSVVGALANFVLIVFGFEVYRAKTGRYGIQQDPVQLPDVE